MAVGDIDFSLPNLSLSLSFCRYTYIQNFKAGILSLSLFSSLRAFVSTNFIDIFSGTSIFLNLSLCLAFSQNHVNAAKLPTHFEAEAKIFPSSSPS